MINVPKITPCAVLKTNSLYPTFSASSSSTKRLSWRLVLERQGHVTKSKRNREMQVCKVYSVLHSTFRCMFRLLWKYWSWWVTLRALLSAADVAILILRLVSYKHLPSLAYFLPSCKRVVMIISYNYFVHLGYKLLVTYLSLITGFLWLLLLLGSFGHY